MSFIHGNIPSSFTHSLTHTLLSFHGSCRVTASAYHCIGRVEFGLGPRRYAFDIGKGAWEEMSVMLSMKGKEGCVQIKFAISVFCSDRSSTSKVSFVGISSHQRSVGLVASLLFG